MPESTLPVPVPEAVGKLYDEILHEELSYGFVNRQLHIGFWDDPESDTPYEEAAVRFTDVVIERLKVDANAHVLDLGCGVGGPGLQIVERTGARVTGISISEEQIKAANKNAADAGFADRAVFRHANAMRLPFEDETFDAVMALESMVHMPDREQVLSEVYRVLRPGGRLVLTEFFERGPRKAERNPAIDGFCRVSMVTLPDVDDYVPMMHRTGLRLRELLDITENTMQRTFREMSNALTEIDRPVRFQLSDLLGVDEFGCLLAVAGRP
ncbi:methyltransferase domain-containing protein [Streptomyces sp. NEAU-YJ-81]|uniref:methyltransferase domain-containing protein n=1 Tax=Streptomyces sp. NEAU-YJ-81 TaxID=2820288 RepID=UPI001ABC9588|nr:methyltransferase domain-containing protein [Streptomyces sp. NEAU-YJ-81]MBO3676495.1 methyltransferase domain-containing protein [Streptomyces sp. NEAU-YJ-81]